MLEPEVEARPWEEQLELDDESYRAQLRYLLERSPFYREKLAGVDPEGGLGEIATLPLTEKDELRASCTRENPIGEHLCAEPSELVRIYSTSGTTTGSPGRRAAMRPPGSKPTSGSSRPTTRARSSRALRSPPSSESASATFQSAPATPNG
jgi:hypothetical protein